MNTYTETSDSQSTDYEDFFGNVTGNTTEDDFETSMMESVQWFFKMSSTLFGVLFVLILYKTLSEKRNNQIYDSLNWKHVVTTVLHLFLIDQPLYSKHRKMNYNSLSLELLCILEISVPVWTACISLKMFTDLYLFRNGRSVYTARDLSLFGFCSIATVHAYELFFIMLGRIVEDEIAFPGAIRLTAILLTISVPAAVVCVIIKSLCSKSSDIVTAVALFYLLHLIVFISCDVCIPFFIVASTVPQSKGAYSVSVQLLYCRLLLEIAWFIGSHYLGKALRIYTEE